MTGLRGRRVTWVGCGYFSTRAIVFFVVPKVGGEISYPPVNSHDNGKSSFLIGGTDISYLHMVDLGLSC